MVNLEATLLKFWVEMLWLYTLYGFKDYWVWVSILESSDILTSLMESFPLPFVYICNGCSSLELW